jgi:hypothetical protein
MKIENFGKIIEKISNSFKSHLMRSLLWTLVIVIVALVIFEAGMFVGFRKASFSFRMGENYYRAFGVHRGNLSPMRPPFFEADFPTAHGTFGKIIKISQSSLVIEDVAGVEKVILLDGNTVIKKLRDDIKISNLLVDDSVVVIGSSNDKSEITAKLIRVMPAGFGHEPSKIIRMKNDRKYN